MQDLFILKNYVKVNFMEKIRQMLIKVFARTYDTFTLK